MAIAIGITNVGEFAVDSAGSTVALTTGTTVSAGSTIIVTGTLIQTETVTGVSDNGPGLTWTVDVSSAITGPSQARVFIASAYAPAGMASGTVITATFSASTAGGRSLTATSFTGIASSSPVDVVATATETVTSANWTSSSTALQAGSVLVACSADFTAQHPSTATSPSIETHDLGDGGGFAQTTCYRIVVGAASYTVAGTWSSPVGGGTAAVAYKASAGATAPSAPQSLGAVAGDSQVALSWSAPASNGGSAVTAYKIYRGTTPGGETLLASPGGTGTIYTDSTAVNNTTYYYKVTAVNVIGESALSNETSATPTAPAVPVSRTIVRKRLYGPTLLSNAAATLYTVPASTTAVIRHVHVSNPTGSPVNFSLSIGTSAVGTRIWDAQPIPANDVLDHYQDFSLSAGEIVQGFASTTSVLNLTLDGFELGLVTSPIYPSNTLFPSDTSP